MAMLEALIPFTELSGFKQRFDDDFTDRLSNRYSMFIFVVLGMLITTRQIIGDPIACWTPAEFTDHEWTEYANRVCWISNTYYVPIDQDIPNTPENKTHYIAYYQWVPIVIFLQAALFFTPSLVWKKLNSQSGIQVNQIIAVLSGAEHSSPEVRDKTIKYMIRNLDRAFRSQKEYRTGYGIKCRQCVAKHCFLICGKRYGNYLITLYLFVKLLYIGNAIGQLFLLNEFLGNGYYYYGIQAVNTLINGTSWTSSKRFPRVTLCDFKIRSLGHQIHTYTVQCTLPINLFHEKIYIFVWFWLAFIACITVSSLSLWIWALFRQNRQQYVHKYLKIMRRNFEKNDNMPSKGFCEDYLQQDGIFVLRLIAQNTNDVVVGEIIQAMWEYYKKHQQREKQDDV